MNILKEKDGTIRVAVYIDDYDADFQNMKMSHMIADTKEELLAMVDKIGVKRKWIQKEGTFREHFDICLSKKKLAILNGAILLDTRELTQKMMEKKK